MTVGHTEAVFLFLRERLCLHKGLPLFESVSTSCTAGTLSAKWRKTVEIVVNSRVCLGAVAVVVPECRRLVCLL